MWRWVVPSLVLWNTLTAKPTFEDPHHALPPHPLGIECCPCPGSMYGGDTLVSDTHVAASDPRAVALDDCQNRFRGSDAEGSSSIFVPRTVYPDRNFVKPVNNNEDPKPLLHPEVGLASNVLETLREATDEEYQEALARDEARNAAKDGPSLGDARSDATKNIVIVLNPSDRDSDALPEASNSQIRYAHPLGRSSPSNIRDETLRGILTIDRNVLHKKIADMKEGASNVNVAVNKHLDNLRLKTDPSVFKLFPKPKSATNNLRSLLRLRDNNLKSSNIDDRPKGLVTAPTFKKIPDLKLSPNMKKFSEPKPLRTFGVTVPKLNLGRTLKLNSDLTDGDTSPSNINEQIAQVTKGSNVPKLRLSSLTPIDLSSTRKTPFAFKNLLKLKDVELITPRNSKVKIELPSLKPISRTSVESVICSIDEDCDRAEKAPSQNIQLIPRGKNGKTEILDALPSASEHNEIVTLNDKSLEEKDNLEEDINEDLTLDHSTESTDDSQAATTNNQEIEDNHKQQLAKAPEGLEQDFGNYDDNLEIIVNENGDSNNEEIIFEIGNDGSNIDDESIIEVDGTNEDTDLTDQQSDEVFESEIIPTENIDSNTFTLEKGAEDNDVAMTSDCESTTPDEENEGLQESRNAEVLQSEEIDKGQIPKFEENIILKLHTQHKPNDKFISLSRSSNKNGKENQPSDNIKDTSSAEKSAESADNSMGTEHLQDMANTLLRQSDIDRKSIAAGSLNCNGDSDETETQNSSHSVIQNETSNDSNESSKNLDSDTLASSHHTDIVETVTDSSVPTDNSHDVPNVKFNQENIQNLDSDKDIPCKEKSLKTSASDGTTKEFLMESKAKEMETGASEYRPTVFPTLRQQVVQPASIFDSPVLNPTTLPSLGDLLSGNSQLSVLPSMDTIASSVSNLFGSNGRATNEEELSSVEFDPNMDCTDDHPVMSSDASTNSKSTLPAFGNPFENINLDIFQLSPLSQSAKSSAKIPSLNLNSFKLSVPKTLQLKPINLQSTLGKNGNLFGASLTFDSPKLGSGITPIFKSRLSNRKPIEVLGRPLGNLPHLEELGEKIRAHAENLLSTPPSIPVIDPHETLQATKKFNDNLRLHTENTVKNIQQSLASTLNEGRINNGGVKLAEPKVDLLEMVTNAHEDMKDKLIGIHTDLKDRLETLHDHLNEQRNLPTLGMPPLTDLLNLQSPFSQTTPSSIKKSSKPAKLVKSNRKPGFRINKPDKSRTTGNSENMEVKIRPFKMSKAASSLTPKSVEVPKLTETSVIPPFITPLHRNSNLKLRERPSLFDQDNRVQNRKPNNNRGAHSSNLRGPQSSETVRPRPKLVTSSRRPIQANGRNVARKPQSSYSVDTTGFASELKPQKVKPIAKTKDVALKSKPFKEISIKKPILNLSKPTDSPLLARLKESLKVKPSQRSEVTRSNNDDMSKSASENNAVILAHEPMKENVTYKCKLICYKEQ